MKYFVITFFSGILIILFSCTAHQKTTNSSTDNTSTSDSTNTETTTSTDDKREQRVNSMGEITTPKPIKSTDISHPPVKVKLRSTYETP